MGGKLQEWAEMTAHPVVALCVVGIGIVSALILAKALRFLFGAREREQNRRG